MRDELHIFNWMIIADDPCAALRLSLYFSYDAVIYPALVLEKKNNVGVRDILFEEVSEDHVRFPRPERSYKPPKRLYLYSLHVVAKL